MSASDADRTLHRRLLDGDPTATAEAAAQFLDPVVSALRARFPKLRDGHHADEAAADAVFALLTTPDRYRPDKLDLLAYLTMSAAGDLRNRLATERRRAAKRREIPVELLADGRNEVGETDMPDPATPLRDRLTGLFDDPADLDAALMMLDGVRPTARYAVVFGLDGRPEDEQRTLVKRHKDRISKMLKRHGVEAL